MFDVPREYLNSNIPEDKVIMSKVEGEVVDIMCKVNPKHRKHLRVDNWVKVLYLQLLNAQYGCMYSAILWYDLYSNTPEPQEFLINPHDKCIENITIKYKQFKIASYVDDNKLLYVDEEVNTKVIEK